MEQFLGNSHPTSMSNLALTKFHQGKLEEARALQEEIFQKSTQTLGEKHPETLLRMEGLIFIYGHQGRMDQATTLQKQLDKLKGEKEG